jgi:hypothetical protein
MRGQPVNARRLLLWAANTASGLVLILLRFDPTRPAAVLALLAVAVGTLLAWRFWPWWK